MKAKLEATANVAVILAALAVGYVAIKERVTGSHVPRYVAAGDRLAPLPNIDWSRHRHTLVLALNSGCHYCKDSVPFYQRLAQAERPRRGDLEIVSVFPNDPESVRQLVRDEGLSIRSVPEVSPEKLGVVAFPTLLLVDRNGRVEQSWVGLLTPRQELDVLHVVSGQSPGCSASGFSSLQLDGSGGCVN